MSTVNIRLLFIFCCSLFQVSDAKPNCKGRLYSKTISENCRTLWICNKGVLETIRCPEGYVVGSDHQCVSEDSDLNACVRKGLKRRWIDGKQSPVDCTWIWGEWSPLDKSGTVRRKRIITRWPENGGAKCPDSLFEEKKIVNCVWKWGEWSAPYGFGEQRRERIIDQLPKYGGTKCPVPAFETKKTNIPPTVQQVAKAFLNSFIRPSVNHTKRQINNAFRDLLLILDSSGSIGSGRYTNAKGSLAEMLGLMCPTPDPFGKHLNRAALLTYSTTVTECFDFNRFSSTRQIQAAIISQGYQGGATCTNLAFDRAFDVFKRGIRANVNREVLILTDGQSNCGDTTNAVARLQAAGIKVYALAIGVWSGNGQKELEGYVSKPLDQHLFALSGFQDLSKLMDLVATNINQARPCAPFNVNSSG